MAAIEEKTYLLCNYTPSKVSIAMKDGSSILMDGGTYDAPSTYPFTLSEIQHINNTTPCIKNGTLIPHDECKEFVYETLRVTDWKSILTNKDIETIILNPTADGLQSIIDITDSQYFDRVYGVFLGLKNADAPITANVMNLITKRYDELLHGIRKTEITVRKVDVPKNITPDVEEMKSEIQQLKELIAAMQSDKAAQSQNTQTTAATGKAPRTTKTEKK